MNIQASSVISLALQMSDDSIHRIVDSDLYFNEINLHCYDNPAKYGNIGVCVAKIGAGDVASFHNGNLRDFVFQNSTAGSNALIVAVGTLKR